MHTASERLETLGIRLPLPTAPIGAFLHAKLAGRTLYVSGQLPLLDDAPLAAGAVGESVDAELAYACARRCAINGLAAAASVLGSVDRISEVLRVGGFVVSAPGFDRQPAVVNGASDLLIDVFGERGRHARAAVGVAALPLGCPVEVEFTFLVD